MTSDHDDILDQLADQLADRLLARLRERSVDDLDLPPLPSRDLKDRGWLTVADAALYISYGRRFVRKMMNERRLWYQRCGGRGGGEVRIPKIHLDEQMALGFPVLDIPPRAEERLEAERAAMKLLKKTRPIMELLPGPTEPDDPSPPRVR